MFDMTRCAHPGMSECSEIPKFRKKEMHRHPTDVPPPLLSSYRAPELLLSFPLRKGGIRGIHFYTLQFPQRFQMSDYLYSVIPECMYRESGLYLL
jgi:hypothetical protein